MRELADNALLRHRSMVTAGLCAAVLIALLGLEWVQDGVSHRPGTSARTPKVQVVESLGEVIRPSPEGTDSWGIGMGAALRDGDTVYLVYSGAARRNEEGSVRWLPHLAVSHDGGRTWQKSGLVMEMPPGRIMVTPESLVKHGGDYYLFYHTQRDGAVFEDAEGWAIGALRSSDMADWEDLGEFVRASDYGLSGALTNPSVLRVGETWYMAASYLKDSFKYGMRLLRSTDLLGPYEDLGMIIDPDDPQHQWYSHGAWDAEIFRHGGRYYIIFGGRSGVQRGSFRHYGLAASEHPEKPWRVAETPFFANPRGQVGGRSAVFPNDDGTLTAVVDLWLGGERNFVQGFRLKLRQLQTKRAPPVAERDNT